MTRGYRWDRNPLRRRTDRLESALAVAAVLLVLASVWPAVLAGRAAYENGMAETRVGPGGRQQVTATLLADARPTRATFGEMPPQLPLTPARWTGPDGTARTGEVAAPGLARSGTAVRIWIDAEGRPSTPPKKPLEIGLRGAGMTLFVELVAVLLTLTGFATGRWALNRRRYRSWDTAWAIADKRGHGHRRG
ncbi:Rv1733c family protein [Nonomuraea wenchangensis]|uniref:Rv1733c family protein n=1 Tax=Nonomuraea wenchangensis TaxID=568860 RepID=UPI0011608A43|nr:hypothetical protein [Nonomuraea wenchangensis]